jgi:uncharacterized membrane protein
MKHFWSRVLKGLAAVLPIGLTIYLIVWFAASLERALRLVILEFMPEAYYWPGMGLVAGIVALFFIGVAVNAWVVRHIFGGALLERIPLVKSVYGALSDFADYFFAARERRGLGKVVVVAIGEARLLGFLTKEHVEDLPFAVDERDWVAVYFPMSYQIGGYTAFLPRAFVEPVDMSVEDALRLVLTAGLSRTTGPQSRFRAS